MNRLAVFDFLKESHGIEGIIAPIENEQAEYLEQFLQLKKLRAKDITAFVKYFQPSARLRKRKGLNVEIVGSLHKPPLGGPVIKDRLKALLHEVNEARWIKPYETYCEYECLHPYTDCNGRSGRAIWLWQMVREGLPLVQLGFLHAFHYQSLQEYRRVPVNGLIQ